MSVFHSFGALPSITVYPSSMHMIQTALTLNTEANNPRLIALGMLH